MYETIELEGHKWARIHDGQLTIYDEDRGKISIDSESLTTNDQARLAQFIADNK